MLLLCQMPLMAAEQELLKQSDIGKIMKQIFSQHVDKKDMTASILKNSFKVYIDQFDPERIYLLEEEVRPFLDVSDSDVERMMSEYQKGEYTEFRQINKTIENAIARARQLRRSIEGANASHLFQKSGSFPTDGYEDWSDPDLKVPFASSQQELTGRIKNSLLKFIASERKRYGSSYVEGRETQTINLYERQARTLENQYLYVLSDGQPMIPAEKENTFSMHVLKALASSLDAHTTVLNPREAYDMRVRLEKEVQGVGLALEPSPLGFIVTQFIKDSPAAKSGQIQVRDRLVSIDGVPLKGKNLSQVTEMLSGKSGSSVNLLFKRNVQGRYSPTEIDVAVTLVRADIAINEDRVRWGYEKYGNGIIGKIQLDSFYQSDNGISSENDVKDAISKLNKIGNLRGLILDMRENSGGFLSQAVKVAGLFITNGVVVISKYFNGEEHFYRDMDGKVSYDGPLIVLTSKATASAAEIVAQALQDYGVALVVGDEHTYGKGTIQSQTVTENQASTFFKVTVGKYYTVSGKTPQIQGVKADIVVPSQFLHENIGEEYLDSALDHDTISPAYNDNLGDIAPNLKPWYMRYYAPTLQDKKDLWDRMIPALKVNSQKRISENKDYQLFLKGNAPAGKKETFRPEDLQMTEATDVMKDMIVMQADMRGNFRKLEGSTGQTAGVIRENAENR